MSIKLAYKDGIFEPIENVESVKPGNIYTAFSDEELRDIRETLDWLNLRWSLRKFSYSRAGSMPDTK